MNEVIVERMIMEQYGALVYTAQMIEKVIIGLTIKMSSVTASRYEEVFAQRSEMTFGQIKKELLRVDVFNTEELKKIDEFNDKRNDLVHNFFWNRTEKIHKEEDSLLSILNELKEIRIEFNWVRDLVFSKTDERAEERNITIEQIKEILHRTTEEPAPEPFRKLKKSEVLIDIKKYNLSSTSNIPIFTLGDSTYWTVCESGLTQYREEIDFSKTESILLLEGIFPIRQFNTNFKKEANPDWQYNIPLKIKRLQVRITPAESIIEGATAFRWIVEEKI